MKQTIWGKTVRAHGLSESLPVVFLPQEKLSIRVSSEDEDAMDEDVPMDQDDPKPTSSKSKTDDLSQYNLDDYDNDEAMPGRTSDCLLPSVREEISSPIL